MAIISLCVTVIVLVGVLAILRETRKQSSALTEEELKEIRERRSALNGELIEGINRSRAVDEEFKRSFDKKQ